MATITKNPESLPEEHVPGQQAAPPPSVRKPKKRGLIWVVFLLIIAAVAGYAVWHAGRPGHRPKGRAAEEEAGEAGRGIGPGAGGGHEGHALQHPGLSERAGQREPLLHRDVKSRVDGQLMKVDFNEGDLVKEGQVLIEIDPRPYQVQLDLAQATLAHDQALLANAKVDLDRYKGLVKTDAIPTQQLDTQTALVAQYEATIKQDQANIDNAKLQLIYSKVTAPDYGCRGPAPGGSRQHRPRHRRERHDHHHPAPADIRAVYHPRGQPSAGHAKAAGGRASAGGCV